MKRFSYLPLALSIFLFTFGYHITYISADAIGLSDFSETKPECLHEYDTNRYFVYYDAQNGSQLQNYTFQLVYIDFDNNNQDSFLSSCSIELNMTVLCDIPYYSSPRLLKIIAKNKLNSSYSIKTKSTRFSWMSNPTCKCKSSQQPSPKLRKGQKYYYYEWKKVRLTDYSVVVINPNGNETKVDHGCGTECSSSHVYIDPCTVSEMCLRVKDRTCTNGKTSFCKSISYSGFVDKRLENTTCQVTQSAMSVNFKPFSEPDGLLYIISAYKDGSLFFHENITNTTNATLQTLFKVHVNYLLNETFSVTISPCLSCNACMNATKINCVKIQQVDNISNNITLTNADDDSKIVWIIVWIVVSLVFVAVLFIVGVYFYTKNKRIPRPDSTSKLEKAPEGNISPRTEPPIYEEIVDFHLYACFPSKKDETEDQKSETVDVVESENNSGSSLSDAYV